MWVSSDQISNTDVTRCPFRHLQNSFETFLIFTPFFSLRGEEGRQKLSSGRLSPLSLSLSLHFFFLSFHFLHHFLSFFLPWSLKSSCILPLLWHLFLLRLFFAYILSCSPHLPSSSILLPEYKPSSWQPNSSKCPTEPSQTCPKHVPEGVCCSGSSSDLWLMVVLIINTVGLEGD